MAAALRIPVEPGTSFAEAADRLTAPLSAERPVEIDLRAFVSASSREEAEGLLALDRSMGSENPEWTAFFVETMVGFLVWQAEPWGVIAETDLDWLIGMVADAATPSTPALLFALVREVNDAPERLMSLAMKHGKGRLAASP
jgi:hypothetical protein